MITIIIVVLTCITSIMAFKNLSQRQKLIFSPYAIKRTGEWYRFISSGFIHGDGMHLAINMFVLFQFGQIIEDFYGHTFGGFGNILYLVLYFGSMIIAHLYSFFKHQDNAYYGSLGASGAVSGIVMAYMLIAPLNKIYLFFIPIGIPIVIAGTLYLIWSWYASQNRAGMVSGMMLIFGEVYLDLFLLFY